MKEYEPSPVGKVAIYGSLALTPIIFYGVGGFIGGNTLAVSVAASLFLAVVCVMVFCAMMAALKKDVSASRLPASPEGRRVRTVMMSPEGKAANLPPVTVDEYLQAFSDVPMGDTEFYAALRKSIPELRPENA